MKFTAIAVLLALLGTCAFAQDASAPIYQPEKDPNRFNVGAMWMLNTRLRFNATSTPLSAANPGNATAAKDHTYDDGFNRVDSTGNSAPPGATSFWGYNNPGQVFDSPADPTVGNDSIAMHATTLNAGTYLPIRTADPQPGFEIGYGRVIGFGERSSWGVEGTFGFVSFDHTDRSTGNASFTTLTDVYSLTVNGIVVTPPAAPYSGPFTPQPGSPLIGDSPTRSTAAATSTVTGSREFDANIYMFRVGPFLDYNLTDRLTVGAVAGLALIFVDGRFSYNEVVNYPTASGNVAVPQSGTGRDNNALVGGYVGARVGYDCTPRLRIFGSANYLGATSLDQAVGDRQVHLDFGTTFQLSAGLSLAF